ncbi:hypothetical protein FNQ90_23025 [Streptomyces alkaliphilus]|uniref:Helix-turn-helix domain-containing protein n=1 Tax=Streptomyces alkaliphilus TaxID=1472722 RepID=A0A7W3THL3_9ACTN|nr:hypothetical protein [Streptomyces alkaliphilus]MBB0246917.1 hypothetical protein [Streptomyces alkaliphilus]
MAEIQLSRPAGGVCHLYVRHTENYIVLTNELITRASSSQAAGVGLYILSVPEGTPVTIEALCARFSEGRVRMSRALRELEEIGFLERCVERGPGGRLSTRTIIHHRPRDLRIIGNAGASAAPARRRASRRRASRPPFGGPEPVPMAATRVAPPAAEASPAPGPHRSGRPGERVPPFPSRTPSLPKCRRLPYRCAFPCPGMTPTSRPPPR